MTITNRVDIDRVLLQMRELKAQTQKPASLQPDRTLGLERPGEVKAPGFSQMLVQAVDKVNETQKYSSGLSRAYEEGDPKVSITQVMVASQKASVSFQAMTQVRNKLVKAYEDIMNMPV